MPYANPESVNRFAASNGSISRLFFAALLALSNACFANVATGAVFGSHMVLQRDAPIPVFGTASNGEAVTVTLGSQTKTVVAPANGKWSLKLDPMAAGGPHTMTIKGNNTITYTDVMVGEVWQIAGQSNMDTRLEFYPGLADSIKTAKVPMMRYITMRQPGATIQWQQVSPNTAGKLSATGYFFGKQVLEASGVAVGLVVTAVGGSLVEQWLDPKTLAENPTVTDANKGSLWNEFVAPVAGYGIRGTAWIQGEQNCNAKASAPYAVRFNALIKGWRRAWGQGDFPFYFGQLSSTSGTHDPNNTSYVAVVREGQRAGLAQPNTAMSVNMDIGIGNWHYPNKPEAGRRLALPALALQYGQAKLEYSGPLYASMTISGKQIKLVFAHTGGGLVSKSGGALSGFTMAEANGNWVWADAVIKGDTVILESPLAKPTRARYAWADRPRISLFNKAGLPASPFSTENGGTTTGILPASSSIGGARSAVGELPAHLDALGRRRNGRSFLAPWIR